MEILSDLKVSNVYTQNGILQEIAGTLRNLQKQIIKLETRLDNIEYTENNVKNDITSVKYEIINHKKTVEDKMSKFPNLTPKLKLVGEHRLVIPLNTRFKDPFVIVTDILDKDIASKVITKGRLDVTKSGTYTITYSVTNSVGYTSTCTRLIVVEALPTTMPPPKDAKHSPVYVVYNNGNKNRTALTSSNSMSSVTEFDINKHIRSLTAPYNVLKYSKLFNNIIKTSKIYPKLHFNA